MALIECPDCGTDVSDSADFCPKCGRKTVTFIDYCPYCDLLKKKKVLMNYNKEQNMFICPECEKTMGFSTPEQEEKWAEQRRTEELEKNTPHCPTCNSSNLKKITTTSKAMNTAMWGILGSKRHKTFHCNSCGYEW